MDLGFLCMSAFAASVILPMSSEVVLGAFAASGSSDRSLLLVAATAGNTLGAVVNWGIGRYTATWRTRLLSLDDAKFDAPAVGSIAGVSGACCSAGRPLVGDPLTLVAGVLRTAFVPFVLLAPVGKAARYLLVLLIAT